MQQKVAEKQQQKQRQQETAAKIEAAKIEAAGNREGGLPLWEMADCARLLQKDNQYIERK